MERKLMVHKWELMKHTWNIQTDKDCSKYLGKNGLLQLLKALGRFFSKYVGIQEILATTS